MSPPPLRFFLQLSYDGASYHGWQAQNNAHSVQAEVERALQVLLGQTVALTGSGRTDTGVHAAVQYAHFDWEGPLDTDKLLYKLNAITPPSLAFQSLRPVVAGAHARYSAVRRSYIYRLHTHKDPFSEGRSLYFARPLDWQAMNEAAQELLLHHDFQSFSKVHTDVRTFLCRITQAEWRMGADPEHWEFHITADRFLRGMVRAIVGTLLKVGTGDLNRAGLQAIILAKDRRVAGQAVGPQGLYLSAVEYPEVIWLSA